MSISLRSLLTILTFLVLFEFSLNGQNRQYDKYRVVFYNVENLFDPFDDPSTNDNEYTSKGKSHWTMARLDNKLILIKN